MEKIYKLFQEESGKHFDPKLTRLFIENFDKFVAIKEEIDGMR
jgi:response regulator RpfG family c-di-GMP phosphodiesterase